MPTLVALLGMATHGHGPAIFHCEKSFLLRWGDVVLLPELLAKPTNDLSNPIGVEAFFEILSISGQMDSKSSGFCTV
jgi:hypothetical protein